MMKLKRQIVTTAFTVGLLMSVSLSARAESLFSPAITVNDRVITKYEIQQRAQMLRLLRAPGDPEKLAPEQLIEERLKMDAAQVEGLSVTEEGIQAGMEEFASRANMTSEQFIRAIEAGGVSKQSFHDFVEAGLSWRELVRARFGPKVQITDADIDKAVGAISGGSNVRVLLSEIIMPASPPQMASVMARANEISQLRSVDAFSAQARRYSAASTRARGGRLDWMPITNLPPALRGIVLGLAPGEVSDPLPLDGAVALFQMRDIEETTATAPEYAAIEYAAYYIAGGKTEATLAQAQKIKARVDTCDDLYGIAKGQPEEVLERGSKQPSEIPQDVAMELAKLDKHEVSTNLTRANGQTLVFLMLCGRTPKIIEDASREEILNQLQNVRLEGYAKGYLAQLRADARIVQK